MIRTTPPAPCGAWTAARTSWSWDARTERLKSGTQPLEIWRYWVTWVLLKYRLVTFHYSGPVRRFLRGGRDPRAVGGRVQGRGGPPQGLHRVLRGQEDGAVPAAAAAAKSTAAAAAAPTGPAARGKEM